MYFNVKAFIHTVNNHFERKGCDKDMIYNFSKE